MTNRRSNKGTLLSSIIAMILCFTMFIGSTLAWFTSTVSNKGNRIEAGTLKVDLLMDKEETGKPEDYVSIADSTGDIFSEATGNGILWEPGKTEIVYLKVENKGSLALKYNIVLTIDDEELAGGLEYAILDDVTAEMVRNAGIDSWKAIEEYAGVQIGDFPTGEVVAAPNGKILAGADGDYFALAVHMKEDANNDYQGKALSFDVKVLATQVPAEEDSFGPDYDEQAVFEGEESSVEKLFNLELLTNGNFETMKSNGVSAANWSVLNGATTVKDDNGGHYLKVANSGWSAQSTADQTLSNIVPGQQMTFKGQGRLISYTDTSYHIAITAIAWGEVGKTASRTFHETYYKMQDVLGTDWTSFELPYTVPVNEKTTNAALLQLQVRLYARGTNEEIHYDNLEMLTQESDTAAMARTFRAMLAEEQENSQEVVKDYGDPKVEKEPFNGQTNVVTNGNLDTGEATGWTLMDNVSVAEDETEEGNYAIKLSTPAGTTTNPYADQWIELVGGAEYQVTYRYKIQEEGAGFYPYLKFEFYSDRSLAGISNLGEKGVGTDKIRDGEWHEVVNKIYPPQNCSEARVLARMMNWYADTTEECWIDDIEVVMTQPPSAMKLETDQIFYYPDAQKGIFTTNANLQYFPELEDAKVDFQVYDGNSLIWENTGVTASEGVASIEFSFRYLMKKEHPYCVKATMYHEDGTVADVQTQNIYIYDRPEYLGADGVYRKNGVEPFYPVYAYHVNTTEHYDEVASAGINLVQMYSGPNDYILNQLDAAEEAGIMGFIALYSNMKPAGHDVNIENTIRILSDERIVNHPALFGYGVMDEVFAALSNPEKDMENSFRLIRMLDPKRPIMTMEALQSHYNICSKYVDILCIDPYSRAASQNATRGTTNAIAAVNNAKPVYTLLEAYYNAKGWPTPQDIRNNCYQALIAGADCVGYYAISDAARDENNKTTAIWNSAHDTDPDYGLWEGIVEFGNEEKEIAYAHFVAEESPVFNQKLEGDYWYYSWAADGGIYMVVLGMKEGQSLEVSIPLTSTDGTIKIDAYTAEIIAGDKGVAGQAGPTGGSATLDLTVDGVEAILYKITPNAQ